MPVDVTSTLREALSKLAAENRRIERQAAAIQDALRAVNGTGGGRPSSGASVVTRGAKRDRRRMSVATRKLISARMKASWAKRKKATSGPRKGKSTK
jgi:hypothetical protein